MKRLNKLYELSAIMNQVSSRIMFGTDSLKLNKSDVKFIYPDIKEALKALEVVQFLIEEMIAKETGLTEQQKWANAEKNIGAK